MSQISAKVIILLGAVVLVAGGHVNVCYSQSASKTASQFKKHVLTNEFLSEGVAVGDVNKDGKTDVIAGSYWFEAPDWKQHEIVEGKSFKPGTEYSDSFLNFSMDVNLDGWID